MEFLSKCCECNADEFLPMVVNGKKYCAKCAPPVDPNFKTMLTTGRHTSLVEELTKIYPCSLPGCKTLGNIRVKCSKCQFDYCLTHRFADSHSCPSNDAYDVATYWKLKYETGRAIIDPMMWAVLCDIETGRGQLSESTQRHVISAKEKLINLQTKT